MKRLITTFVLISFAGWVAFGAVGSEFDTKIADSRLADKVSPSVHNSEVHYHDGVDDHRGVVPSIDASFSNSHKNNAHPKRAESRFAPASPMSVVHFVKPERYLADSGDTVSVSVTIRSAVPVSRMTFSTRAEKGAVVSEQDQDLGAFEAGEERSVSFDVTVLEEGRRYVNVVTTAVTEDGLRQSSYSVPIEVGDARAHWQAKSRQTVTDEQGNTLILMPARMTQGDEQPR